ncbi:MAG: putative acyltransferase [Verrucomicrobiaceae bacterium]|nr:putative acyltransferase [Verrucomicrobiaceae bacterium]
MECEATSPTQPAPAPPRGDAGLHGALLTKCLLFWLGVLPMWLCTALATPISFVIYCLAGPQRRGVCANLDAMRPEDGPWICWWNGYRVFREFGLTYLDRLWHLHFGREVEWELSGAENMNALRSEPGGVLVFTVHAGNYDMGSDLFANRLGRDLHTVRTPEQTESLRELRGKELADQEKHNPNLHVHYNESNCHLGLELCKLLQGGQIVAIQGDRVVMDVSPTHLVIDGLDFRLPRGPLVLAEMTRVPCYSVFLSRKGRMSYLAEIGPAFCTAGERLPLEQIGERWLVTMHAFLHRHWDQWFVFEHLVSRA